MLVDRYGNPVIKFSETEQKTGETWIDGKPIYKKTVHTGVINNASAKKVQHGISNIGNYLCIDSSCSFGISSDGNVFVTLPRPSNKTDEFLGINVSKTTITINTATNCNFADSYVTLKYTKTTD